MQKVSPAHKYFHDWDCRPSALHAMGCKICMIHIFVAFTVLTLTCKI